VTRGSQPRSTTEPADVRWDNTHPAHPGQPADPARAPAAIALISVCLGFFVIQLHAMCRS
jgi:hypothetical protein